MFCKCFILYCNHGLRAIFQRHVLSLRSIFICILNTGSISCVFVFYIFANVIYFFKMLCKLTYVAFYRKFYKFPNCTSGFLYNIASATLGKYGYLLVPVPHSTLKSYRYRMPTAAFCSNCSYDCMLNVINAFNQ